MKKAQVTVFIVTGIVLVILVGLGLYMMQETTEPGVESPRSMEIENSVKLYVETCLETTLRDAISYTASRGGYYSLPYNANHVFAVPYYSVNGIASIPRESDIEPEIAHYIKDFIGSCTRELSYIVPGYNVKEMHKNVSVVLAKDNIIATLYLPLTLGNMDTVIQLDTFQVSVPSIYMSWYERASNMTEAYITDPGNLPFFPGSFMYDKNTSTIILTLNNSFRFAWKYEGHDCNNLPIDADMSLLTSCINEGLDSYDFSIDIIPDMKVVVNHTFNYTVHATGHDVMFRDYSTLFDINASTGAILFTATDIGIHNIWISATDSFGTTKHARFHLNITDEI